MVAKASTASTATNPIVFSELAEDPASRIELINTRIDLCRKATAPVQHGERKFIELTPSSNPKSPFAKARVSWETENERTRTVYTIEIAIGTVFAIDFCSFYRVVYDEACDALRIRRVYQ